jgi:hypothetical protein
MEGNAEESNLNPDKALNIICYNCGEPGHFSATCIKPKVCFICFREDHLAERCLRWKEPYIAAQFMGSANRGLGFFHIDVEEKADRFKLWTGFDNCGVFTIEEGVMSQEDIIKNLKMLFDPNWCWQLKQLDDSKFLVRFPPEKKVENVVINNVSFFYLQNNEVQASLRVWNGNIEPISSLKEVWVQVRGIPPRWCDWITLRQIASALGKLVEVDWQSLFGIYFAMIRIKIKCKDPSKVPKKRLMEMGDDIYLLYFKTEGVDQETNTEEGGDGKGGKGDKGDDDGGECSGEEDFLDEDLGKEDKDHTPQKDETPKNLDNNLIRG